MKTYVRLLGGALLLLLGACTKEDAGTLPTGSDEGVIRLRIEADAGDTRTTLSDRTVAWATGDRIGLFSTEACLEKIVSPTLSVKNQLAKNAPFDLTAGAGSTAALFSPGTDRTGIGYGAWYWNPTATTHRFYAYSPYAYSAGAATPATAVPLVLPALQEQPGLDRTDHIGALDFTYAQADLERPTSVTGTGDEVSTTLRFTFRHALALIRFEVENATPGPFDLHAVRMEAPAGTALTGDFTFDLQQATLTPGQTLSASGTVQSARNDPTLTVVLPEGGTLAAGSRTTLYAIVAPADLQAGVTFTVETSAGEQSFPGRVAMTAGGSYGKRLRVDHPAATYTLQTVSFDEATLPPEGYLQGSDVIGDDSYGLGSFYGYTEHDVTLRTYRGDAASWGYAWWCGFALSNRNDRTTEGYANEMSVYVDGGARSGTQFAVGYNSDAAFGPEYVTELTLAVPRVIDHAWFANTTYAALAMQGKGAKRLDYADGDYFLLRIEGFDAEGNSTGTVDVPLADFRTPDAPGIRTEWIRCRLSSLGTVAALHFALTGTDIRNGSLYTPAYFCMDDLALRLPVTETSGASIPQ